jgi:hypothetical protein
MATRATKEQAIELSPQFEQISQELIVLFKEVWRRDRANNEYRLKINMHLRVERQLEGNNDCRAWLDFCSMLKHAFVMLHLNKNAEYDQWYQASFIGSDPDEKLESHSKQEMLFWKYFDKHYRSNLMKEMSVVPH